MSQKTVYIKVVIKNKGDIYYKNFYLLLTYKTMYKCDSACSRNEQTKLPLLERLGSAMQAWDTKSDCMGGNINARINRPALLRIWKGLHGNNEFRALCEQFLGIGTACYNQRGMFQQSGSSISAMSSWNFHSIIDFQKRWYELVSTQSWFDPHGYFLMGMQLEKISLKKWQPL